MEIGTVITTTVKNAKASESLKCGLCEQIVHNIYILEIYL